MRAGQAGADLAASGAAELRGASNHAEIWDKSRWDAECAKLDSDDLAGIMDELGF